MMRINSISIENFKGVKGSKVQTLHGLDLIIGENGSGKTTLLESIVYALLGYLPGAGRGEKPQSVFADSARDNSMTVGLQFDDYEFSRSLSLINGSVSQEIRIQGQLVATNKAEAEIAEKLGQYPVMFDIGKFTSLSDDLKKAFVFEIAKSDDVDRIAILKKIEERYYEIALPDGTPSSVLEFKFGFEKMDELGDRYVDYLESLRSKLEESV